MRLGCAAYSYRQYLQNGEMTLEAFIEQGAELGLHGVELTAYYFASTDDAYLMHLKQLAFRNGVDIFAAAVGNNYCRPDPAQRAEQVKLVKQWVDIAFKLGAPCLRVFAGPVPEGATEAEARAWTIDGLRACAAYAAPKGVALALENHGGITTTAVQVLDLLHGVDSPWVKLNLDTGNFREDPYTEIERVAPFAVTTHAKVHFAHTRELVDYDRVVSILRQTGYQGYLSIEYEAEEEPGTAIPALVDRLRVAIES